MQALVHFSVGTSLALLALTVIDWPVPREFLLTFASGVWALLPDFHWLFWEFGLDGAALTWQTFHRSVFANVFWFHRALDLVDGRPRTTEVGIALAVLLPAVLIYYRWNVWAVD